MVSLTLDPGETAEATVTLDDPGDLLHVCHVSGHFEGGMVGTLTVT